MRWVDLLFAHWPITPEALRALIPADLEIDTYDGRAWLGIVPFRMEDVGPRGLPAPPVLGAFPELNVRTYVTHRGRPGVWFLSLDAASRLAVEGARRWFHLPYVLADMKVAEDEGVIAYASVRRDDRLPPASLVARYRATGPIEPAVVGSIEAWFTERWRLFAQAPDGRIDRTEIRHAPWPLQPAAADIDGTAMAAAHGLALPSDPPHLRFARRVDVVAWWPRPS
jgi:uncharacterized protein YqjF (DUF2071 family)